MARQLFGTDGVRGVAGEFLTEDLARALGRAAAERCEAERPQILIIRDTRESGPALERALAEGIAAARGDAFTAGVLPTPAASVLVRRLGLDLAAVISASHNPWRDNGIKFIAANGAKLREDDEAALEARVHGLLEGGDTGSGEGARELHGGADDYLRELAAAFRLDLAGRKVALDCANGATHEVAPEIFRRLGADVVVRAAAPDGRNINEGCGSTHPELLAALVAESGAEIGFAFDGDGDRVVAVDGEGTVRDGDELIALSALHLHSARRLGGGVAVTVMTNLGFHNAMAEAGIPVATTAVGDRNVSAELERRGWSLGGEQSGHLIWTGFAPTGDGIAAALLVIGALGAGRLQDARPMNRLPQVLRNVEITDRAALEGSAAVREAIEREGAALEGRGRVLVRPSGTEPLVRVMVEAPSAEECELVCERLAELIRSELG